MLLAVLLVLWIAPALVAPQTGLALAQNQTGAQDFGIERDDATGDRTMRVGGVQSRQEARTMRLERDAQTGDRIMHVAPSAEKQQEQDALVGPLLITPEIKLPMPRKPHKGQ